MPSQGECPCCMGVSHSHPSSVHARQADCRQPGIAAALCVQRSRLLAHSSHGKGAADKGHTRMVCLVIPAQCKKPAKRTAGPELTLSLAQVILGQVGPCCPGVAPPSLAPPLCLHPVPPARSWPCRAAILPGLLAYQHPVMPLAHFGPFQHRRTDGVRGQGSFPA